MPVRSTNYNHGYFDGRRRLIKGGGHFDCIIGYDLFFFSINDFVVWEFDWKNTWFSLICHVKLRKWISYQNEQAIVDYILPYVFIFGRQYDGKADQAAYLYHLCVFAFNYSLASLRLRNPLFLKLVLTKNKLIPSFLLWQLCFDRQLFFF